MDEIFEKVKQLTVDELGISEDMVNSDTSFTEDLEADSLDLMQLMMAIEEEFDLDEISDEDAESIVTVQDAVSYIYDRL